MAHLVFQVVPALHSKAARIVNYIRHPTWVLVNLCPDITKDGMGTNFEYSEEEKSEVPRRSPRIPGVQETGRLLAGY